jgi:hypothetical protein
MSGNIAFVGYATGITLLINLFFGPTIDAAMGLRHRLEI